ncbi:MAG: glutamine amidotransferase [Lentimonas sp.]|jgi:glutamine amidotransferase
MIAIIDYGAGNVESVRNALRRLNQEVVLTADKAILQKADKVIFPGVGDASFAMDQIKNKGLTEFIPQLTQPVLGICLGMQLLCKSTEEGNMPCLGVFDTWVKKFPESKTEKIPHMGWNNHSELIGPLFKDITLEDDFYFVHNYYAEKCENTIGSVDYILPISSALSKDNFFAAQFHPEKSSAVGQKLIKNFLEL